MRWQQTLGKKGWFVGAWPRVHGGQGCDADAAIHLRERMRRRHAPGIIPFGIKMVGPVIYTFGNAEQKAAYLPAILASDRVVVPGLFRAGLGLRPRVAEDHGRDATATITSSTARRSGPRWRTGRTGSSAWCAPTKRQAAGGHLLPADRHEDARHHRAADPHDGWPPPRQRGVLRQRARSAREPRRQGGRGLDVRQVPAHATSGSGIAAVPQSKRGVEALKDIARVEQDNGRPLIENRRASPRRSPISRSR